MSIESLKEQARRHEQKEEWLKALDQYKKAISQLEADDQPDIGLYNRVGDLFVRVGKLDDAVEHYDKAVDLYLESELPNNAIAVCKKIIRNVPERHRAYLRMGQIRAQQGFLSDARTNFLTYAERMQQAGDLDESFRALIEFCDLAPDDVELRLVVADQMASHERSEEAVQQLSQAYRALMHRGDTAQAAQLEAKIHEIDPSADMVSVPEPATEEAGLEEGAMISGSSLADDGEIVASFGEIELGGPSEAIEEAVEEQAGAVEGGFELSSPLEVGGLEGLETTRVEGAEEAPGDDVSFELPTLDTEDVAEEDEGSAFDLPLMDLSEETAADDGVVADLPLMDLGGEEDEGDGVVTDLPLMDTGEEQEEGEVPDLPLMVFDDEDDEGAPAAQAAAPAAEAPVTLDGLRARIVETPDDVTLRQRFVEVAYQSGDEGALVEAYVGLGEALQRTGEVGKAKAAYQQALQFDPSNETAKAALGQAPAAQQPVKEVAAHEDYVDLGALILGDEGEKSTRFVVAYEEPSGDEQADFAKMLSQFKEKVSENLDADDVRAHHDLGTAYKEMGLLDEAVSEFQQALRASADHLPTYEMLGQTFIEMGKADAAVRSLQRALEIDTDIEDELIGIYYYLARAYETVGNKEQAVEFYDRVFSLDINFADVTERLRALR